MPLFGRIGRPGLLGTAARTAVIAGTATATSGAIRRHQMNRQEEQYEAELYQQQQSQLQYQQAAAAQTRTAGGVSTGPASTGQAGTATQAGGHWGGSAGGQAPDGDLVAQLSKLADLHQSGALTDKEFAAAKAQLVG